MRRLKMRAVRDHKKLKEVFEETLERGLSLDAPPKRIPPKPVKLRGRGPLTIDEIEAAINWGRE